MSDWGELLKAHAQSHYEFGWDSVIECLCDADLEDFAVNYKREGGTQEGLIAAAATHFNVPDTIVTPLDWVVVSRDIDGTHVRTFASDEPARQLFTEMCGRSAPTAFPHSFNGIGDFGNDVSIIKPKSLQPTPSNDDSPLVTRHVAVLGNGPCGPVFHDARLTLTQAQAEAGVHYDTAKLAALEAGLEEPLIAFDEFDPATVQIMHVAIQMTTQRERPLPF